MKQNVEREGKSECFVLLHSFVRSFMNTVLYILYMIQMTTYYRDLFH